MTLTTDQRASMAATVAGTFDTSFDVWRGMPRACVDTGVACARRPADTSSSVTSSGVPQGDPYVVRVPLSADVRRNDQLRFPDGLVVVVARIIRYPSTLVVRVTEDLTA